MERTLRRPLRRAASLLVALACLAAVSVQAATSRSSVTGRRFTASFQDAPVREVFRTIEATGVVSVRATAAVLARRLTLTLDHASPAAALRAVLRALAVKNYAVLADVTSGRETFVLMDDEVVAPSPSGADRGDFSALVEHGRDEQAMPGAELAELAVDFVDEQAPASADVLAVNE